jgi:hypothetical protein
MQRPFMYGGIRGILPMTSRERSAGMGLQPVPRKLVCITVARFAMPPASRFNVPLDPNLSETNMHVFEKQNRPLKQASL